MEFPKQYRRYEQGIGYGGHRWERTNIIQKDDKAYDTDPLVLVERMRQRKVDSLGWKRKEIAGLEQDIAELTTLLETLRSAPQ